MVVLIILKSKFPQVLVIENKENIGFARANNQAMQKSSGKIWVLLNSDTIVRSGVWNSILDAFSKNPNAFLVGPQLLNMDLSIQPSYGKFASLFTELFFQLFLYKFFPAPFPLGSQVNSRQVAEYQLPHCVDWLTAACIAVRPEVSKTIGLLKEDNFMYGEDMEWCWRARNAGFECLYWPDAKVIHLGGKSAKKNFSSWIKNYTTGNLSFIQNHRSRIETLLSGLIVSIGSLLRIAIWIAVGFLKPSFRSEARSRINGYWHSLLLGLKAFILKKLE